MRTPRKIVVATDFSASADRALDVALAIGAHGRAEIHLVHALELPRAVFSPYAMAIPDDLIGGARDAARKKLDAAAEKLRARGCAVTTTLGSVPASAALAGVHESAARSGDGAPMGASSRWRRPLRPAANGRSAHRAPHLHPALVVRP